MKAEIVADGLVWPEGPGILPDGSVAFVETYRSQVSVWTPGKGVRRLAYTRGGPNAVCLGSDDCLYVTQNGGLIGEWHAEEECPGAIQRVSLDGRVEVVVTEVGGVELRRPNDLAFGPDGRLYFTDPGLWDPVGCPEPGHVFALDPDGTGELIAEVGPVFPNGLVVEADGSVVWTESYPRRVQRRTADGTITCIAEFADANAVPDGLAVAADGSLYVSVLTAGGLRVVGPDGEDRGTVDAGVVTSNCCFSGADVYITDGGSPDGTKGSTAPVGMLWKVETDTRGFELFQGQVRAANAAAL
jgi:gluconolactonase